MLEWRIGGVEELICRLPHSPTLNSPTILSVFRTMTPRRAVRLAGYGYYSENAAPKSSARAKPWVHRDFYAQECGFSASPRFHIYASICAGRLICACGTSDRAAARQLALAVARVGALNSRAPLRGGYPARAPLRGGYPPRYGEAKPRRKEVTKKTRRSGW